MTFKKIESRKSLATLLIFISFINLAILLLLADFPLYFYSFGDFISSLGDIFVLCPQAITMPIISMLIYLASPWKNIYIIYFSIWSIVFVVGSAWTALLAGIFQGLN